MIYCYLFEAKSIQQYLFRSGKLKDVIAASERLDNLIDSKEGSTLNQVLINAGLDSDLLALDSSKNNESSIHFLRCKGGAFYCYCQSEMPLMTLRSLWTLTLQQLFPSLEFTDALTHADNLSAALDLAHQQLATDRNNPTLKFPFASAISARYQRSGKVAVPLSKLAFQASMNENSVDLDTEHHRQAYKALEMKNKAALQDRFTPPALRGEVSYPVDIEKEFQTHSDAKATNLVATRDIALIHIDGNGLGILLMGLKNALKRTDDIVYQHAFRQFSDALNKATIEAAQKATQWIADNATYTLKGEGNKKYLPMRPIVLGGDDVTLLCRADLALTFSKIFCDEFKVASEKALAPIYEQHLKASGMKPYLTASGGILYNKAGHPFISSLSLVEDLCGHAKKLTKSITKSDSEVGPAALAFYRISNAISSSFDQAFEQSQVFALDNNKHITMGKSAYFVEEIYVNNLKRLDDISKNKAMSPAKWRQMATLLSQGDLDEAEAMFNRVKSLMSEHNAMNELSDQIAKLLGSDVVNGWYSEKDGMLSCIINDLLIIDHFQPVIADEGENNE
ncbi:hypothetical protein [uncultured Psychromonas sp.]|uniref:Cas10/Cmr2 second palm domain-containing protein n=1 Tax=uncultured Psychromonas sp. TaxID=173974 RepID=UPI002629DD69|nr:hypothetical protein [uncultured Psychromonas sp.]